MRTCYNGTISCSGKNVMEDTPVKSNDMKVLHDDNGNRYRFSSAKFHLALVNKRESNRKNGLKTSVAAMKRTIADRCFLSEEAVKKWELGHNGPGVMEHVLVAAEVLDIPYTKLLDPVKGTKKNGGINERNRQLIDMVFRESMAILIRKAQFKPDAEERKARETQRENKRQDTFDQLQNLIGLVEGYALSTSPYIRSRLSKLLIEMQTLVDDRLPEAWNDISEAAETFESGILFSYYGCDRDSIIKDGMITAMAYVLDETDYADELGLEDIRYPDDAFYETDDPITIGEYGYHGDLVLTPDLVYGYCLSHYLKAVFEYYFPEELGEST